MSRFKNPALVSNSEAFELLRTAVEGLDRLQGADRSDRSSPARLPKSDKSGYWEYTVVYGKKGDDCGRSSKITMPHRA